MSREIKFRAWDVESKVFIDWDNFMNNQSGNWMMTAFKNNIYKFQQFTGLKDKNGKEIYEGDIIYWEINNGIGIESYTAIVKWSENLVKEGWNQTYKWLVGYTENYYRGSYDELSTPAAYNDALQIIGNIWEDGDLLNDCE